LAEILTSDTDIAIQPVFVQSMTVLMNVLRYLDEKTTGIISLAWRPKEWLPLIIGCLTLKVGLSNSA
jgi:hypothetical protein